MNVSSTTAVLSVSAPAGTAAPLQWQAGQRLTAVVLAQTGPQSVSIRVGNHTLEATTTLPLPLRSQLQLEVVQGGAQPMLRVIPAPPPATADVLGNALRTNLPQQLPLQQVFSALGNVANDPAALAKLPAPTQSLLTQLFAQLPAGAGLPATVVQRALRDSGVMLEHKLARGAAVGGDLKANLLQMLATLAGPDVEHGALERMLAAGVARIEVHQLTALMQSAPEQAFSAELPLRGEHGVDVVQLRFERDGGAAGREAQHAWTVWLAFDIAPLGPVQARVSLRGEAITALLWAEQPEGAALIDAHLAELETTLSRAGLQVKQLQCRSGAPPQQPFTHLPSNLVDVTA